MNSIVEEQQQQKMPCLKAFSNKLQFRHTSCRQLQMVNSYHSNEREFSNNWHKITIYDLSISSHCTRRDATLRRYTLGPKSARYLIIKERSTSRLMSFNLGKCTSYERFITNYIGRTTIF